jgi:DNA-binding NtrC family response regulator
VLVIDDDSGNRRILESRLSEHQHEVVAGENGALGLSLARESRFDLVLVSTELRSGVDGFEVCRRVKAMPDPIRPGIVLFCGQAAVPEVLERGFQAGCDAFVSRPDLPSLEHVIRWLLRQRARLAELEEEVHRLTEQMRRVPVAAEPSREAPRAPARGAAEPAREAIRPAREPADRAAAVREFASGRPDGLLLVDSEGAVRHADRGACEMLGGSIEGRHLGNLAPSSGLEAYVRDARLEARDGFRFDLSARKGHAVRQLSATVIPLVVQPGHHDSEMRVVLLHDIARRRTAAEMLHLHEPGIASHESGPLVEAARETFSPAAMIGESASTRAIRIALAEGLREAPAVLLRGPAGSGKERAARILHYSGPAAGAFVHVRCGALTPEDLDLELFGRARGANGDLDRPGLVHLAQDGTLFLEEIGDAPLEIQEKLLRLIDEGVVSRDGSRKPERVRVRIVASSSAPLEGRVQEGRFSAELLERFEATTLLFLPLAERLEDVEPIARHYVLIHGASRGISGIAPEALTLLAGQSWKGNVDELVDWIHRACARAAPGPLAVDHLPESVVDAARAPRDHELIPSAPIVRASPAGTHAVSLPEKDLPSRVPRPPVGVRPWDITDEDPISLDLYEKKALLRALDSVRGDKLAAARLLKVGKSTLYRKLKQFGIG